jgi:hypothetical protein
MMQQMLLNMPNMPNQIMNIVPSGQNNQSQPQDLRNKAAESESDMKDSTDV